MDLKPFYAQKPQYKPAPKIALSLPNDKQKSFEAQKLCFQTLDFYFNKSNLKMKNSCQQMSLQREQNYPILHSLRPHCT